MEGLNVVGPTGGTVRVIRGVAKVVSGKGIADIVFMGSSPYSTYGGTGGANIGGAPGVQNSPLTDFICQE